jgi:hypothetical protein
MEKISFIGALALLGCANLPQGNTRSSDPSKERRAVMDKKPYGLALHFVDLIENRQSGPEISVKARSAHGRPVRMVGYMAHLELAPSDGFYLSPTPVYGDEMGAGTGDLPLTSVRVYLDPMPKALPDVEGLVAVEGTFELGPKEDPDGSVTHFRLLVHSPPISQTTKPSLKEASP